MISYNKLQTKHKWQQSMKVQSITAQMVPDSQQIYAQMVPYNQGKIGQSKLRYKWYQMQSIKQTKQIWRSEIK